MRKLTLLTTLGLFACASVPVTAMSGTIGAGSVMRHRGGASQFQAVRLGFPINKNDDPNEPFMHIDHYSQPGPALESSDENAQGFDVDWCTARRKIADIVETRQAAAALRLRGGSSAQAAAVATAASVPVSLEVAVLHIKPIGSPPVKVVVCGDGPELGAWDIAKGVTMDCAQDMFPLHTATINLPAGKTVEYKYAVVRAEPGDGVQVQWEAQNRKLTVPASGTLSIKNEFVENRESDPRITDEPFQCNAQEWARWYKHHVGKLTDIGPSREG